MEISAIEVLTRAILEVDRALDTANTTLSSPTGKKHYNHQLSLRRSPRLQSCRPAEDEGVYTEVFESDTNEKVIQWQVGADTAQSTIRAERLWGGRQRRRRLRQHNCDSISENAALSCDRLQKRRSHSVHCGRENRLPPRTHQGWRRGARKATTRVATGDTGIPARVP